MDAKEFRIGNLLGYLEVDLDNGGEVIKNHPCTLNDIAEIAKTATNKNGMLRIMLIVLVAY